MLFEEIQPTTQTLLEAHAFFTGFTWVVEDGKTDNRAAINAALREKGIYGVVQRPQNGETLNQTRKGVFERFWLPVTICENEKRNQVDAGGFGSSAEKCSTEAIKALIPNSQVTQVGTYSLLEESRRWLGNDETGAAVWLVNFLVKIFTPTT